MNKEPDYVRSGIVAGLTVIAAVILFFLAKSALTFLLDHWFLTLLIILGVAGGAFYALINNND